jgi:hypothetical protein
MTEDSKLQSFADQLVERIEAGEEAPEAGTLTDESAEELQAFFDTQKKVHDTARREALAEAEAQEQRRQEFVAAKKAGRPLPAVRATPIYAEDDPTLPIDTDGKLAGTPGYVKKWVATIDGRERPNEARVRQFIAQGWKPVKSRENGKVMTQMSHMLLEAPPEVDARRRAAAMEGRVTAAKQEERAFHSTVDQMNRDLGKGAFRPVVQELHGAEAKGEDPAPMRR